MSNETKADTEFNVTVLALWEQKSGNLTSGLTERSLEQLVRAVKELEVGGKLIIKKLPETSRQKFQNPEKAPTHFLEYMTKEDCEAFATRNKRNSL